MSLEHAILGFLSRGPVTGYDLKTRCFDRDAAPFWTADQAQIYRTLERLQASGMVVSELVAQPGRPDKRVFDIAKPGKQALLEWLETPHPIPPVREPLLLQLHFSDELSGDAVLALLATARGGYQSRLESLRAETASGPGRQPDTAASQRIASRRIALDGAIATTRATIDWIDDSADRIRQRNSLSSPVRG